MADVKGWLAVIGAWVASGAGYIGEHMSLVKLATLLAIILTAAQIWKTWLDIQDRRRRRHVWHKRVR